SRGIRLRKQSLCPTVAPLARKSSIGFNRVDYSPISSHSQDVPLAPSPRLPTDLAEVPCHKVFVSHVGNRCLSTIRGTIRVNPDREVIPCNITNVENLLRCLIEPPAPDLV